MSEKRETSSSQAKSTSCKLETMAACSFMEHLKLCFCSGGWNVGTNLCVGSVLCPCVFLHGTFFFDIRADAHKSCPAHWEWRCFKQVKVKSSGWTNMDFDIKQNKSHTLLPVLCLAPKHTEALNASSSSCIKIQVWGFSIFADWNKKHQMWACFVSNPGGTKHFIQWDLSESVTV